MPKRGNTPIQGEMLQGTLDLLVLRTLVVGPAHGHTIAHAIERQSDEVLQVEHGSLYPALHRLEDRGWILSFWGTSENNRRARYYRLTPTGRRQLAEQTSRFETAVSELAKLQSKGIAQANAFLEDATRVAREQIAFAEQLGSEWRKLVLASAKTASEIFAPKA